MKELLDLPVDFWEQDRQLFYYSVNGVDKIGGYWADNRAWGGSFTLLTIPKSGHFAPYDNYYTTFHVLEDMINDGHLSCHASKGHCSVAAKMCKYMDTDESQGTCMANGQYKCDAGFIGADCSNLLIDAQPGVTEHTVTYQTGYGVLYFAFENMTANEEWSLTIDLQIPPHDPDGSFTPQPVNLYAYKGTAVAPSKFDNDLRLLKIKKSVQVSHLHYECGNSCVFALESIGFDQARNQPTEVDISVIMERKPVNATEEAILFI